MTIYERVNEVFRVLGLDFEVHKDDPLQPGLILILEELAKRIVELEKK